MLTTAGIALRTTVGMTRRPVKSERAAAGGGINATATASATATFRSVGMDLSPHLIPFAAWTSRMYRVMAVTSSGRTSACGGMSPARQW
jgi:hypothetical protein